VNSLPPPPIELLDLVSGYQRSKTLFALIEFKLPTLLAQQPLTAAEIADRLGLDPFAADSLLNASVALDLLARAGPTYRNSPLAEEFLVEGKPTYLGDQFASYDQTSYPRWADLTEHLRRWRRGATDQAPPPAADQGPYGMRARHNQSLLVGHALAQAYDFSRHHLLLDLGGGTGAMTLGICAQHTRLRSLIYDLPGVAALAAEYIGASDCAARVEIVAGNFKHDELPAGFDVALLANLLSVASEATNRKLFAHIYERLPVGGVIILSGYMLNDDRVSPLIPALFSLQDIIWQAPDVEHDVSTYGRWLADAGFIELEHRAYCPPTSLLSGRKG
jgi:3-hydroxy-5-methyl-1-naphthoate 3-O-methyltransferase